MKQKMSGPAIFMHTVIVLMIAAAAGCFVLYYGGAAKREAVLWTGIVAFIIVYHFWLRLIMGNVTRLFRIDRDHWWFRERKFEEKLYDLLRVKRWKDRALTYDPESFSLEKHTLDEIADVMTKSELDHWINELISLTSILFALVWGQWWIFILTAAAAMLFDAQFIVIQRYNRPRVLRVLEKKRAREIETVGK